MTPNDENLGRLEQFLAATEHQTKEEALAELASQGVDVAAFKTHVAALVRKGYRKDLKKRNTTSSQSFRKRTCATRGMASISSNK